MGLHSATARLSKEKMVLIAPSSCKTLWRLLLHPSGQYRRLGDACGEHRRRLIRSPHRRGHAAGAESSWLSPVATGSPQPPRLFGAPQHDHGSAAGGPARIVELKFVAAQRD